MNDRKKEKLLKLAKAYGAKHLSIKKIKKIGSIKYKKKIEFKF